MRDGLIVGVNEGANQWLDSKLRVIAITYERIAGCPAWIRTTIDGVRVRSLTIRRRGNALFCSGAGEIEI